MAQAAIYVRISDDRAGQGLGVARQENDCRALSEARGWQVVEVFTDNDVSAYSGKPRPAYTRMLGAVKLGAVGAIVAWDPDRLHRSPRELEDFIDLVEAHGVKVATVNAGEYDLSTAAGRMTARVVGAVARHESEHKSERSRRKALELAQAGKISGGGTRPYGYEADRMTVREDEAEVIREAARRIAAGEALRGVIVDLTARGLMSPTGRPWPPSTFKRMICSPRIAGLRHHTPRTNGTHRSVVTPDSDIVGEAVWPAILDRPTWEAVRRILTDPSRRLTQMPARSYLLTGLVRCGVCGDPGAKLVARPRGDKARCYVCAKGPGFNGCGKIRVLAEPLEQLVSESVLAALDGPGLRQAMARSAPAPAPGASELPEVERRLEELAAMWSGGEIERREWLAAREPLLRRRDALQRRAADQTRIGALSLLDGDLRGRWEACSFDQRRAVLAAVLETVVVGPAVKGRNRFDPDRIWLTWRA